MFTERDANAPGKPTRKTLMIDLPEKTYLGDAVYAEHDGYQIVLTTEGGYDNQTIYLETSVLKALIKYSNDCDEHFEKLRSEQEKERKGEKQ